MVYWAFHSSFNVARPDLLWTRSSWCALFSSQADQRFVWNGYLLRDFFAQPEASARTQRLPHTDYTDHTVSAVTFSSWLVYFLLLFSFRSLLFPSSTAVSFQSAVSVYLPRLRTPSKLHTRGQHWASLHVSLRPLSRLWIMWSSRVGDRRIWSYHEKLRHNKLLWAYFEHVLFWWHRKPISAHRNKCEPELPIY